MSFDLGSDPAAINSLEIAYNVFEDVQSAAENVELPMIMWPHVIPLESVDTSINPGAQSASYRVRDRTGTGQFRGRGATNIPIVGLTNDKVVVPVESAGIGANFDRADARAVAMGFSESLPGELGEIMREGSERHIEATTFYGYPQLGFQGFINHPNVPIMTATANAAGTSSKWTDKTASEIIEDISSAIARVFTTTRTLHVPGRVLLPPAQFALLAAKKAAEEDGNKSAAEYVATNNIYTTKRGGKLEIMDLRYLEGAGAGSTDRMIVYEFEKRNYWMPMSVPFQMLEPQQNGFGVDMLAEYVFGSFHAKRPLAMQYVDGI